MRARSFPRPQHVLTAVLVLLLVAMALGVGGCSSLSKPELEARLLALEKNAGLRELGLRRAALEGDEAARELVYLRVPASGEGGAERTPVVLVHGTPSTLFTWGALALGGADFEGLRAERDLYLVEVLGHGLAPSGSDPLSFQACADYVAAAVRSLDLGPVFLVGQSYGGEFAWRAALDSPELFAGLVLMSSSGVERRDGDWLPEEVEMRENSLADLGWLINSRERVASALAPHFRELPPDCVEEFFLVCENRSNWTGMIDLARDENGAREAELAEIALPTLLLWGAEDAGYAPDPYARRFAEAIPGARLELVPEAGHYPHEERPERVAVELEGFFREVEAAR